MKPLRLKIQEQSERKKALQPVILKPVRKPILHDYFEEALECVVSCYPIEEVIAEKLRALLQTHQKLVTRGWNRPRARDYYDLWSMLKKYKASIDAKKVLATFSQKCKHRGVKYQSIDDFFTPELVSEAQQHWQATLRVLVLDLPDCSLVLEETKQLIAAYVF